MAIVYLAKAEGIDYDVMANDIRVNIGGPACGFRVQAVGYAENAFSSYSHWN